MIKCRFYSGGLDKAARLAVFHACIIIVHININIYEQICMHCVELRKCGTLIFCELFSFDKLMQRFVGKSTRGRAACSAERTQVLLSYWLNTLAFLGGWSLSLEKQWEKSACMLVCHELWSDMLAHIAD